MPKYPRNHDVLAKYGYFPTIKPSGLSPEKDAVVDRARDLREDIQQQARQWYCTSAKKMIETISRADGKIFNLIIALLSNKREKIAPVIHQIERMDNELFKVFKNPVHATPVQKEENHKKELQFRRDFESFVSDTKRVFDVI